MTDTKKKKKVLTFGELYRKLQGNWRPAPKDKDDVKAALDRKQAVIKAEADALRRKSFSERELRASPPKFAQSYIMTTRWSKRARFIAQQMDRLRFVQAKLQSR